MNNEHYLVILYYISNNDICNYYHSVYNPIAKAVNSKYPNIKFARFDTSKNEFLKLEGLIEPVGMPSLWIFEKNSIEP